jgi:TRAP-type transport system periplasmic protein
MKKFLMVVLALLVMALVGCSTNSSTSEELPEVNLKFGHNAPGESPTGMAAEKLAELVKEKSGGTFTIEVFPENQLGDNRNLVEQTSIGGLDMSMSGLGVLGYLAPEYNFMQIPFIFRSQEHIHKVVEGEIGLQIADMLKKDKDILLLSQSWDRLPRQVSANKSITTPKELENLLIRTGTKGATETFSLLGAKPTSVPLKEVYLSLQNNIIEGVELPADHMVNSSVAEVNSHLNMTNHTYGTQFVAINGRVFNDLPKEYQDILMEAVTEAGKYNNQLTQEEEGSYLTQLEEQGMEIVQLTQEQHDAFTAKVKNYIAELEAIWPEAKGLGEKILSVE